MPKPSKRTIDALGREYASLLEVKANATARMAEIDGIMRDALEFGPHLAGDMRVTIAHNVSRNDKLVAEVFPASEFPQFYKPAVDGTALKRGLTGEQYEALQVEGAPKVLWKALEDEAAAK